MPKLILHIGTHKTGTTSIQRFCSSNRDALRERGVWYPPADLGNFPQHYAHHHIAHAIADRAPSAEPSDATDFFKRVRRRMGPDETCLISAEPLYRHMLPAPKLGGDQTTLADDERDRRFSQYAAAVRDCIGEFDVTVLVMLRRQDKFLESLYAEQVLSTGYTRPIERFASERNFLLDYEARLASWAQSFGDRHISVKVFDPSTSTVPIEQEFVEWLGVEWGDDLQIGQRRNVTPSRTFVEFKRMLNIQGQSADISYTYRRWVEQLASRLSNDDVPDLGRYYLQPRDRVELLDRFEVGNRAVAERYRNGISLFSDDVHVDLAKYVDRHPLTDRDFRKLAKLMFRMIADEADG